MRRMLVAAVLASSAALTLAACTGGDTAATGEQESFVSQSEANDVYKKSVSELQFPDGYTPPESIPGLEQDAKDTSYQATYGDTRAHYLWQCVWEKEWLDKRASDPNAASNAMTQLEKAPSMAYLADSQRVDDATRRIFKENLDKAKLGDPSGVQEDVSVNCK